MALTELTAAQWAAAVRKPGHVEYINDPALTDVMYTVAGDTNTLVINLANFADLADGKVKGAAIDADSLEAGQIAAGAVDTSELADDAVTGVKIVDRAIGEFDLPTATSVDHGTSPTELLALDTTIDRIVVVRAVATEAALGGPEIDVGSAGATNSLFDDIGGGTWAIGDKFQGMCLVEAGGNLRATVNVAGTAGAFDIYVTVVTPLVQTAQITNLAVTNGKIAAGTITDAKMAYPQVDDPGSYAQGVLRVSGNSAVTDTFTIGSDIFELDDITAASGDTCQNDDWNNTDAACVVDMNVGDYANIGVGGVDPLQVGDLVFVGAEYMRVTVIGTPTADDVTFSRGRCGTAAAVHVDTVGIFIATTPHVANITIGSQAGGGAVAAAVLAPLLVGTILDDDGAADQANIVSCADLGAGAIILFVTDAIGVSALATQVTGANKVWDHATLVRGAAAGRERIHAIRYTVSTPEASTTIYIPLPFVPTSVSVTLRDAAGTDQAWDGAVTIVAAAGVLPDYALLTDSGATNFANTDTIDIIAVE